MVFQDSPQTTPGLPPHPPPKAALSHAPLHPMPPPRTLQASPVSVVASAEPAKQRPPIPLEIMPAGEFEPLYR